MEIVVCGFACCIFSLASTLCIFARSFLYSVVFNPMRLSPPIKPDAAGYPHMKDVHKKHISLGYGFLFCVLLQAVWKSF